MILLLQQIEDVIFRVNYRIYRIIILTLGFFDGRNGLCSIINIIKWKRNSIDEE